MHVLITGATGKLGRVLTQGFGHQGDVVIPVSRTIGCNLLSDPFPTCDPQVIVHAARDLDATWAEEWQLGVLALVEMAMYYATVPDSQLRSIIVISSIYGMGAVPPVLKSTTPLQYGCVKAGMIHVVKELAVRLAPTVRVNAVSYGGVVGRVDKGFEARYAALCPQGRMLQDADVFGPVKFLASEDASGVTGHNLVVDGGWTAW